MLATLQNNHEETPLSHNLCLCRSLSRNKITALPVGVFQNLTILSWLCVKLLCFFCCDMSAYQPQAVAYQINLHLSHGFFSCDNRRAWFNLVCVLAKRGTTWNVVTLFQQCVQKFIHEHACDSICRSQKVVSEACTHHRQISSHHACDLRGLRACMYTYMSISTKIWMWMPFKKHVDSAGIMVVCMQMHSTFANVLKYSCYEHMNLHADLHASFKANQCSHQMKP